MSPAVITKVLPRSCGNDRELEETQALRVSGEGANMPAVAPDETCPPLPPCSPNGRRGVAVILLAMMTPSSIIG